MKPSFSRFAGILGVYLLILVPATAQEKSVRPDINKPFENPDLKDFVKKFEGESREIAVNAKEIVAASKIKPGMAVADVGAGTGLFTRKFAAETGDRGRIYAVDIAPTDQGQQSKLIPLVRWSEVRAALGSADQRGPRRTRSSPVNASRTGRLRAWLIRSSSEAVFEQAESRSGFIESFGILE